MASSYTSLLGLALPVTGELSGSWGDVVNDSITSLLDTAVAGTTTLSTDGDVTLSTTTGASNQARQAILLCSGARTALRTITAPAQSKIYTVINATTGGYSVKVVGAGPTTGVTIVAGESAVVAWNGSDFIKISNTGGGGSFTNVTISGTTTLSGLTASTALALNSSKEVVSVTNTGTGNNVLSASPTLTGTVAGASLQLSSLTSGRVTYAGASGLLQDSANLTFNGTDLTVSGAVNAGTINATTLDLTNLEVTNIKAKDGTAGMQIADSTGVVSFTANPVMSGGTANGVTYLNGSKVLTTGSALTFDGTNFSIGGGSTSSRFNVTNGSSGGFEVNPDGTNSGPTLIAYNRTGAAYLQLTSTALNHVWQNSGTETMRLTSTGLGIGTSSPSAKLHVNGSFGTTATGAIRLTGTGQTTGDLAPISFYLQSSGWGTVHQATITAQQVSGSNGGANLLFGTSADGSASPTTRMTLDPSGTLGLGVTPSAWAAGNTAVDIGARTCIASTNSGASSDFTNNGYIAGGAYIYKASAAASFLRQDSGDFRFYTAPSGTAGNAISFTQAMTLDASGNLGIGTSSPAVRLDVQAARATSRVTSTTGTNAVDFQTVNTGGQLLLGIDNSAGSSLFGVGAYAAGLWYTGAYPLVFGTNNTERARIDASGNFGLGVTPSAWNSSFRAMQLGNSGYLFGRASQTQMEMGNNAVFDATDTRWEYITTNTAQRYLQDGTSGSHQWFTAPSGTAGDAISFTQAMTLNADGNFLLGTTSVSSGNGVNSRVSIGNTSDSAMLYLKGKDSTKSSVVAVEGPGQWAAYMTANGSASSGWSGIPAAAFGLTVAAPIPMVFATDSTERARIDSSGNLLVGTTSGTTYKAQFVTGDQYAFLGYNTNSAKSVGDIWNAATTGDNIFFNFITEAGGTARGSITYNRAGGLTAYNTTSDYRAKDITGPVTDSGALIDSTPVYMGKMKGATQERPMFIAHETPAYAHTGEKDAVDADGNPVYQQMDATALVPVMWAEIQSLRQRLAAAGI